MRLWRCFNVDRNFVFEGMNRGGNLRAVPIHVRSGKAEALKSAGKEGILLPYIFEKSPWPCTTEPGEILWPDSSSSSDCLMVSEIFHEVNSCFKMQYISIPLFL
jgi:hypothetical protein